MLALPADDLLIVTSLSSNVASAADQTVGPSVCQLFRGAASSKVAACLAAGVFFFACVFGRIRRARAVRLLRDHRQASRVHVGRGPRYRTPSLRRLRQLDAVPLVVVLASHLDDPLLALRGPQKYRIHFRPFFLRLFGRGAAPLLPNLPLMLLMMVVMVMMMMMMTSLTTGRCAPCRGPAHHSIQRAVVTLPPVHRDDFFRSSLSPIARHQALSSLGETKTPLLSKIWNHTLCASRFSPRYQLAREQSSSNCDYIARLQRTPCTLYSSSIDRVDRTLSWVARIHPAHPPSSRLTPKSTSRRPLANKLLSSRQRSILRALTLLTQRFREPDAPNT